MKKTILTLSIILAVSTTAAADTNPETLDNVTLNPGEQITKDYELTFEGNATGVDIQKPDNLDHYSVFTDSSVDNSGDTVSYNIIADDTANVSEQIEFTYDVQNTSETFTRTFTAETKIPYNEFEESPLWVNKSFQLDVNGDQYNVSQITASSLYFNNNSIQVGGAEPDQRTFNDVRITLQDQIPSEYAKIKVDSKKDDATFDYNILETANTDQNQGCKLGIRTITTLQRGNSFAIETIDQNTGNNEVIGGVSVTLVDSGAGQPIGNTQSGSSGYASIYIPEDTEGPVVARLGKTDSNCQSNNQQVSFNRPYNVYINENEKFQLNLNTANDTFYTEIEGTVTNKRGSSISNGILNIEKPNGQVTDTSYNKTGFTYQPENTGEYKLTATKEGYVKSSTKTVEYIADKDNDGVPNDEDQCPETEGVQANNGCPKVEANFQVYQDGEIYTGELRPNQQYQLRLINENRSTIDFTGQIPVDGADTTLQFQNGEAENGVKFASTGNYGLTLNKSRYETQSANLQVQQKELLEGVPVAMLGIGLLAITGLGLLGYMIANSSSTSTSTARDGEFSYDLEQLNQGGGN
jgi:hypothetical protein